MVRKEILSPSKRAARCDQLVPVPGPHRVDLNRENLGGAIFGCDSFTRRETLNQLLFCLPRRYLHVARKVRPGLDIFLYDFSEKQLLGVYTAISDGENMLSNTNLDHRGQRFTRYSSQVKVQQRRVCRPLALKRCRRVLRVGTPQPNHFYFDLDQGQVEALNNLFQDL